MTTTNKENENHDLQTDESAASVTKKPAAKRTRATKKAVAQGNADEGAVQTKAAPRRTRRTTAKTAKGAESKPAAKKPRTVRKKTEEASEQKKEAPKRKRTVKPKTEGDQPAAKPRRTRKAKTESVTAKEAEFDLSEQTGPAAADPDAQTSAKKAETSADLTDVPAIELTADVAGQTVDIGAAQQTGDSAGAEAKDVKSEGQAVESDKTDHIETVKEESEVPVSEEKSQESPVNSGVDKEVEEQVETVLPAALKEENSQEKSSNKELQTVSKTDSSEPSVTTEAAHDSVSGKTDDEVSNGRVSIMPSIFRGWLPKIIVLLIVCAGLAWLPYWWYLQRQVSFPSGVDHIDVTVSAGASGRAIAASVESAGIGVSTDQLVAALKFESAAVSIHAGRYRFYPGMTLSQIAQKLLSGEVESFQMRIPDGATIWQVRNIVESLPDIVVRTKSMTDDELRKALGIEEASLEGVFAPETYRFRTGITDLDIYRAAYKEQMRILENAWNKRDPSVSVKSKYSALILASIIEKETSRPEDRPLVSSVFNNRLRVRMPLQTDPSVIYGIGKDFDGNLRKSDLQRPGPYNTYLNYGLPPTPISMPAAASIEAALHPEHTQYFYFVARGDGTTEFSRHLSQHNRAVEKYQKAPARRARSHN